MDALLRILALVRKEMLAIFKDPRSRASVVIPPIIQVLIFGYAATYDLNRVRYAVYDRDRSVASRHLIAGLDGSGVFQRVADLSGPQRIGAMVSGREALLVVQIDPEFERHLVRGEPADVQVVLDGRNSNTANTALGYVNAIVESFNARWRESHGGAAPPLRVTTRAWFNPNLETRWHMVPGMIGLLTMLQVMLITAMSVAREREQGTFDQLLVTPFRPAEIMVGKAVPSILLGLIQATAVLLVAQLWFHIPFSGSYLTLYAALVVFFLAAVGIGLFISSLVVTMQQAMLGTFVVLMPFSLLSGLTTPISSMPQPVQYLTALNPLRYAIAIVHRVFLEGAGFGRILPDLWPMVLIAAVTLSVAAWMFRHRLT